MEKKYTPFLVVGIVIALMFAILVFAKLNRSVPVSVENYNEVTPSADLAVDFQGHDFYLFTREGCPHCAQVQAYREQHAAELNNLDIVTLQMDINDAASRNLYQEELTQKATICGLDTRTLGVPFFFDNRPQTPDEARCLVGDTPIITLFNQITASAP